MIGRDELRFRNQGSGDGDGESGRPEKGAESLAHCESNQ